MPDERKRYGLNHEHIDAELTLQAELAQVKAERDAARERIARLENLLLRMCEGADFMPDEVAELLHASTPKEPT